MKTYKDWSPTPFDHKGAFLDDRDDWIVAPVIQTRDSNPFEQSNFDAALKILGGENDKVEVHSFNHWGPGWIEIILVHPDLSALVESIESKLEDYPVLDEDDLCQRESDEADESIQ